MEREKALTKFPLGRIVATPNVLNAVSMSELLEAIGRHGVGDWGSLDKEDWDANERALQDEGRLFSAYISDQGVKFWIITECDRSATTLLLPEDY